MLPILRASDLTVRRADGRLVLDAVDLSVEPGHVFCLLGTAGAGKTAILHAFAGLLRPTSGKIWVDEHPVLDDPVTARRHLTYIPKGAALYPKLTARENLEFFVRVDGSGAAIRRSDYHNVMRRVGIPERSLERMVRGISPALSLALWLALALLKDTRVLLIDEPSVGLDVYESSEVQDALVALREMGKTLLVATGDVLLAGRIADVVGILKEGRKTIEIPRADLIERSLLDLYLQYMGRPMPGRRTSTPRLDFGPAFGREVR